MLRLTLKNSRNKNTNLDEEKLSGIFYASRLLISAINTKEHSFAGRIFFEVE
jgi:hypothetical protein